MQVNKQKASFSLKFINKDCLQHGLFLLLLSFNSFLGEFNKPLEWSRITRQKYKFIWEEKHYEEKQGGKES